ncbi:hypothetical protein IMZ48_18640 [Candidatus Bathyarchaeota archaeon]|nr:hypothetical protein [Candidatus Bathyarchaeota archaeon]
MGDHARPITPRSPFQAPANHLSSPIGSPIQETKALVADEVTTPAAPFTSMRFF